MLPESKYRTNDPTYLSRKEYEAPKEYVKAVTALIEKRFHKNPIRLIDLGCASGGFLFYASEKLNLARARGVDISDQALGQAKSVLPEVEWVNASLLDLRAVNVPPFDVVTCLGTVAVFDDLDAVLRAVLSFVKPGGYAYIYDVINDDPIDVVLRYRRSANEDEPWQPGLNVRSRATYEKALKKLGGRFTQVLPFKMPFAIERSSDPMRAWTVKTEEDPYQLMVGTGQLLKFRIAEIQKS